MAFVVATPDHIDVALHAAFALHAGKSALLLFNCSHTNLEPLALIFYLVIYLFIFYFIYLFIYLFYFYFIF